MRIFIFTIAIALLAACSPKGAEHKSEQCAQCQKHHSATAPTNHAEYCSPNAEAQQEVFNYIMEKGVFYIATADCDQPRVRPFGALHIFEGKMYIITGHVKRIAKQLAANPKVEICAVNGTEWVRVAATLVEDERVEAKKSMLDANPNLRSSYNENDDNIAVYYFTDAVATFSSFAGDGDVVKF